MELEITPEPTSEERAAILQALARLAATDGRGPISEWWSEGLREAVLGDSEEYGPGRTGPASTTAPARRSAARATE